MLFIFTFFQYSHHSYLNPFSQFLSISTTEHLTKHDNALWRPLEYHRQLNELTKPKAENSQSANESMGC